MRWCLGGLLGLGLGLSAHWGSGLVAIAHVSAPDSNGAVAQAEQNKAQREESAPDSNGAILPDAPVGGEEALADAIELAEPVEPAEPVEAANPLAEALRVGEAAAALAATARTPQQWDQVVAGWLQAIAYLHQVPPDSPQRIFAQRKGQLYQENLAIAQRQAAQSSSPRVFPSLGSSVLDEQIGLYLSYIATFGPPDVLVVGSSRALQGVDPQALQGALRQQGLTQARVYTFGVNGATAQLVSFLLRQVLTPAQLPRLILWAEGSRGFNSGRVDRTFASVLSSPGFRAVQAGQRPRLDWGSASPAAPPLPISSINAYGFLPLTQEFNPNTYYRQFPRVSGQYDGAYQNFNLDGVQTLSFRAVADFARSRGIPLIFVNLPLSGDYLDPVRLQYERQFQAYLQREAQRGGFQVVDLLEQWRGQNRLFADPSHINQAGAQQLARQLAGLRSIPWQRLESN